MGIGSWLTNLISPDYTPEEERARIRASVLRKQAKRTKRLNKQEEYRQDWEKYHIQDEEKRKRAWERFKWDCLWFD